MYTPSSTAHVLGLVPHSHSDSVSIGLAHPTSDVSVHPPKLASLKLLSASSPHAHGATSPAAAQVAAMLALLIVPLVATL